MTIATKAVGDWTSLPIPAGRNPTITPSQIFNLALLLQMAGATASKPQGIEGKPVVDMAGLDSQARKAGFRNWRDMNRQMQVQIPQLKTALQNLSGWLDATKNL